LAKGSTDLRKTDLWPKLLGTPKAQDSRAAMKDRGKHNMGEQVQEAINALLPTPRVSEAEGAPVKNTELKNGSWSRVNQKGVRFGVKVKDVLAILPTPRAGNPGSRPNKKGGKVLAEEIARMLPTPNVMDTRNDIRKPGEKSEKANKGGCSNLREKVGNSPGLKLQPNFVEWMMGYPQNWTDLNYQNQDIG
jgi:hypothetical protein